VGIGLVITLMFLLIAVLAPHVSDRLAAKPIDRRVAELTVVHLFGTSHQVMIFSQTLFASRDVTMDYFA